MKVARPLLACVVLAWSSASGGCASGGQHTLGIIDGPINDPGNRSLRRSILSYGLDQFCQELRKREAPLKLAADGPTMGRFYPSSCAQKELEGGDLDVDFSGVGYVWTNLTKKLAFSMHAEVRYDEDFLMDGSTMYAYFRTRKVDANDFQTKVIEQPLANFMNQLSPTADSVGRQLLGSKLAEGFTVIREANGTADFGLGIIEKGRRPPHPYQSHGSDRMVYENDRSEVHQNERDLLGPITIEDSGRAIYLSAGLDGLAAMDLMVLSQATGSAELTALTERPNAEPLVGPPPILGEALQQGIEYRRTIPLPPGIYYVLFDNTPTAGVVNPPGNAFDDRAGSVRYLVEVGTRHDPRCSSKTVTLGTDVMVGSPPVSDPFGLLGNTLAGHFLVESLAGEGRRSVVYKGEYLGPKEPVALKCLKVPALLDAAKADAFLAKFRDGLRKETKVVRGKPNFVRTIGSGITTSSSGAQVPFTVQEWLYGQSLADDIKARRARGAKGRTLAEVFTILAPAMSALALAHAEGIPHGDLNTGNFFLAATGEGSRTTILDFAIARVARATLAEIVPQAAASDAMKLGIAPEQVQGAGADASLAGDVFAVAMVILELLRDRAPDVPSTGNGPTPRSVGLTFPTAFESAMAKAAERDPAKRFANVQAYWSALEQAAPEAAATARASAKAAREKEDASRGGSGGKTPTASTANANAKGKSSSKVKAAPTPAPVPPPPVPAPPDSKRPKLPQTDPKPLAPPTRAGIAPAQVSGGGPPLTSDTVPDAPLPAGLPAVGTETIKMTSRPITRARGPNDALPSIIVDGEGEEEPTQPGLPMVPSAHAPAAPLFAEFADDASHMKRPRPPRNLPDGADKTILVPRTGMPPKPKPSGFQSLARVAILSFVVVFLAGATAIAVRYLVQKG